MCRPSAEGGRRCYHGTEYERLVRNLQARKQYHNRKNNAAQASEVEAQISKLKTSQESIEAIPGSYRAKHIPLSQNTEKLLNALTKAGYKPYIVGGTVRDSLTGEAIKDVDIEVYGAEEDELFKTLKKVSPHVDQVGQQFGVTKIRIDDEEFDVSLPRTENNTGAAHTSFEVETNKDLTIEEASARRDFTVNALMYDNNLQLIIDPHGGLQDWDNRQLKHVSDAFDEDPLRVLRGVQMAARFNMDLHPDTVEKAKTLSGKFKDLSKERVQVEFQKLFTKSFHPEKGFKVLKSTEWDQNLPGLSEANTETMHSQLTEAGQRAQEGELNSDTRTVLFGALVASHIEEPKRRDFLSYITVGDKIKNQAYNLATTEAPKDAEDSTLRHWAKDTSRDLTIQDWVRLNRITKPQNKEHLDKVEERAKTLNIWDRYEADILNGNDLISTLKTDKKRGRWVGEAVDTVRAAQYSNKFRTKKDALKWVEENRENLLPN